VARKPAEQAVSREEILNAAANVFRQQGYHGAKMSDIAGEVDLTAGSLYHHFSGGKSQILREVMNNGLDMVTADVRRIVEDTSLSPDAKLRDAIRAHVLALTANTSVAAALVFETRNILMDEEGRNAYIQRRDTFEQLFRGVVEEGIAHGAFRPVDARLFTKALLGAHNWVGVWYRDGGRLTGEEIASDMADIYLRALAS
jgi:TetR/AcrR family transcriptional regulator, cholesterol catabolism regulator